LHAIDGNFSLSRQKGAGSADPRSFTSCYHISPEEVDRFKDEVQKQKKKPADAPSILVPCSEHWVASKSVREGTIGFFEQTGIFISVCRHGIVETYAEMWHSGEL
jgi:hypothetical protein